MQFLLPIILQANEEIQKNRTKVKRIRARADNALPISDEDLAWLAQLSQKYRTSSGDFAAFTSSHGCVARFFGYGSSCHRKWLGVKPVCPRGQRTLRSMDNCTLCWFSPLQRDQDKSHKIRVFSTPLAAVRSIFSISIPTLPTKSYVISRAYLRNRRPNGAKGYELAMGLKAYSEKGMDYVALVLDVIRQNRLEAFHSATR